MPARFIQGYAVLMRWLVAALGVVGLAGGVYFGMAPRFRRSELRVALNLRPADPDDAALAEGVGLAIEERDERAGRYRLKTAHQTVQANGLIDRPHPCAHTMLYGLERHGQPLVDAGSTRLLLPPGDEQARILLEWMRSRGLKRLSLPLSGYSGPAPKKGRGRERGDVERAAPAAGIETSVFITRGKDAEGVAAEILVTRPDAVLLSSRFPFSSAALIARLREQGFDGSVFLWASRLRNDPMPDLEGGLGVLAPLKPAPAGFRHPHPFAYVGYRGALDYLDVLDANPQMDPLDAAKREYAAAFEALRDEPRVYELKGGRFHTIPPK
jgi:hypothetical protein